MLLEGSNPLPYKAPPRPKAEPAFELELLFGLSHPRLANKRATTRQSPCVRCLTERGKQKLEVLRVRFVREFGRTPFKKKSERCPKGMVANQGRTEDPRRGLRQPLLVAVSSEGALRNALDVVLRV